MKFSAFGIDDLCPSVDYRGGLGGHWRQPKLRGWRVMLRRDLAGQFQAITKGGANLWPRLARLRRIGDVLNAALPSLSILDCELHAPGRADAEIPRLLKRGSDELRLTAFAAPVFAGRDRRPDDLAVMIDNLGACGLDVVETVWNCGAPDAQELLLDAKRLGLEGYVLKTGHYEGWQKLKVVRTCDLVVHAVMRDAGKVRKLMVGTVHGEYMTWVAAGLTARDRALPNEALMGRVAVVEYDYVGARGALVSPRIAPYTESDTFRHDKPAAKCQGEELHAWARKAVAS